MSQSHKSQQQIKHEIELASRQVEIGAVYAHYKNPDMTYIVKQIAYDTETEELCVVYEAEYGERLTFVRPLRVWLEKAEWQGERVPRFVKSNKATNS